MVENARGGAVVWCVRCSKRRDRLLVDTLGQIHAQRRGEPQWLTAIVA